MSRAEAYVYRAYDVDGDLLYVGCTQNVELRFATHRTNAEWFPLMVRREVEGPYPRTEALAIEKRAARGESPQFGYTSALSSARRRINKYAEKACSAGYRRLIEAQDRGAYDVEAWHAGIAYMEAVAERIRQEYAEDHGLTWALADYSQPAAA